MFVRSFRFWPLLLLAACARTPRPSADVGNKYDDDTVREIGTAQDERNTAALLPYLTNPNPAYRREAALAFASVQAPAAVPGLLPLLRDADPGVRRAAAYALGQTGDSTAVDSLCARVQTEPDNVVRRYVYEALGRTVTRRSLPKLWHTEPLCDTAQAAAQAWGLSRAALRGLSSAESIRRTVLLLNWPQLATRDRLPAVVGLARTRGYEATLAQVARTMLLRMAVKDRSYAIRAAAATMLGKLAAMPSVAPGQTAATAQAAPKEEAWPETIDVQELLASQELVQVPTPAPLLAAKRAQRLVVRRPPTTGARGMKAGPVAPHPSAKARPVAQGNIALPGSRGPKRKRPPTPKAAASPAAVLVRLAIKDPDYRVRLSAVRALPFNPSAYSASRAAVFHALRHDQAAVALAAAEWLLAHARGETGAALAALADGNKQASLRVRSVLLHAAVRYASPAARPSLTETIRKRYPAASSTYEKSFLLPVLAEDSAAFDLVHAEAFAPGQAPVVASAALAALLAMRRRADFPAARYDDFTAAIRQALGRGDLVQLGTAAEALADRRLYPRPDPDDLVAIRRAQARLLPREVEAWQVLQRAINKLDPTAPPTPPASDAAQDHPIDWDVVERVPPHQQVRLRTTKGIILLELKPNEAPGAVASFVALLEQNFYDHLYFHRVVANFVAQGGDPDGEGSGSAPYTLRSEFGDLRYQEGSVGLASAGKDTESCQFFITHAPTPHLDGRYPIFAQVVGGLDVVHKLDIGDQILSLELVGAP